MKATKILFASLGMLTAVAFGTPAQAMIIDVRVEQNLVSVSANNTSVYEILSQLSSETGVQFSVIGNVSTPISLNLVDVPLETAIAKIAPSHSLVHFGGVDGTRLSEAILIINASVASNEGEKNEFLPTGLPTADSPATDMIEMDTQSTEAEPTVLPAQQESNLQAQAADYQDDPAMNHPSGTPPPPPGTSAMGDIPMPVAGAIEPSAAAPPGWAQ